MPEYVYALHDFLPENDDEVTFKAGDRVEVVEKDDAYGDGWWKGRNLDGRVGLFPASYTTLASPAPPANEDGDPQDSIPNKFVLNTLLEESESGSPRPQEAFAEESSNHIHSPVPKIPPVQFLNGDHDYESTSPVKPSQTQSLPQRGPDEVMQATLTDVQEAIEQLGNRQLAENDFDGSRSFSFASSRDTDTDFDLSDLEGPNGHPGAAPGTGEAEDGAEGWHKNAREKLAVKARKAVEEAEKLEAMMSGSDRRMAMPPIDVEVSDESDDEPEDHQEDYTTTTSSRISGIPEEDEGLETDQDPPFMRHRIKSINERQSGAAVAAVESAKAPQPISPGEGVSLNLAEEDDTQPATATRPAFPSHIRSTSSPFESSTRSRTPQRQDATSTAPPFPGTTTALQSNSSVISVPVTSDPDQHTFTMHEISPERQNSRRGTPISPLSALPPSTTEASLNPILPPTQRSMSPPTITSSAPLTAPAIKRASVLSARSANSGHSIRSSLPPASAEPSSPLPPIPLDITPASTQRQHSRVASPAIIGNGRVASPSPLGVGGAGSPANGTLSPISIGEERSRNGKEEEEKHPTEWSVDEVVGWLKSKGFDQDVCDKFIEQEITGDVLLELDVNLLKSEIGILAFGKRARISNAISDLRRPPSLSYSDSHAQHNQQLSRLLSQQGPHSPFHSSRSSQSHQPQPPQQQQNDGGIGLYTPVSPQSQIHPHSRTQSQSHSSISGFVSPSGAPGATGMQQQLQPQQPQHGYSNSVQSSLGSPFGSMPLFQQQQQQGLQHVYGSGAPPVEVGLGIVANGGTAVLGQLKTRPTSLSLSPSDSALKMSAGAADESLVAHNVQGLQEDERGHMSDGEISAISKTKVKRKLWTGSSSRNSSLKRLSKDSPVGAQFPEKDKPEARLKEKDKESVSSLSAKKSKVKKNVEGNEGSTAFSRASERLSIFGGTFTGRSRKPPPSADFGDEKASNSSKFSLARLGSHKRTSVNPNGGSFIDFSPQPASRNLPREPSVLRKRTNSSSSQAVHGASPVVPGSTLSPQLSGIVGDATPVAGGDTSTVGGDTSGVGGDTPTVVSGDTPAGDNDSAVGGGDSPVDDSPVGGDTPTVGDDAAAIGRATSTATRAPVSQDKPNKGSGIVEDGRSILEQIGEPDHAGWMRKRGGRYNTWRTRYLVLKGSHLYWMRSNSKQEKTIKGYIHVTGYKVSVDENLDPGRYGFRIDHDHDRTHCFSSDEKSVVRDWTKAIMKATIDRDYTKPVVSSCNIPTIPLTVAQAMNPAPRPPSPTARAATQKALRRDNPDQLSSRDAEILMGLNSHKSTTKESSFHQFDMSSPTSLMTASTVTTKLNSLNPPPGPPPPRPVREARRQPSVRSTSILSAVEEPLVEWANGYLPPQYQIVDSPYAPLCSGLTLLRLAEAIKGKPASPPVPDSAFPEDETDDKLEGLFRLFDFLLDNEVKMGSVSINDVKCGKRDKILQLLKGLKAWDEKRRAIIQSIGKSPVQAAGYVAF